MILLKIEVYLVSISSPSSEGGGFSREFYFSRVSRRFPLVLLQAKVVGDG